MDGSQGGVCVAGVMEQHGEQGRQQQGFWCTHVDLARAALLSYALWTFAEGGNAVRLGMSFFDIIVICLCYEYLYLA